MYKPIVGPPVIFEVGCPENKRENEGWVIDSHEQTPRGEG